MQNNIKYKKKQIYRIQQKNIEINNQILKNTVQTMGLSKTNYFKADY